MNSVVMQNIERAAHEKKLLQITYVDAKNRPSIRTVEPYELKEGGLYAYCRVKEQIRLFKLDKIQSAQVSFSGFTPRFPIYI